MSRLTVSALGVEGTIEFTGLLFVPSSAPQNLHYRDSKHGLQLYANKRDDQGEL